MGVITFLSGGTISQLRGLAWLALDDLGQIGTATITDDGGGGGTASWSYGGTVACRIDPLLANETIGAGEISDRSTHIITTPPGTAATITSRFQVLGRGTFEITAVQSRTGEALRFFEAVQVF